MAGSPVRVQRAALLLLLVVVSPGVAAAQDANRQPDQPVSFGDLIRAIPGDFKSFPSKETALWIGVGAAGSLAVYPADTSISDALSGNETLGDVFSAGDVLGSVWVQGGAAVLAYAIGRAAGSARLSHLGSDLIRSQVLSQAIVLGSKLAVHRTRPDGGRFSFPSGHATAGFASAVVVQEHFGWKLGVPAYLVAGYIGISRVQGRHHYPSDVVFGSMVGVASARTVTERSDVVSGATTGAASVGTVTLRVGRTRLQTAPAVIPRGVYVGFVVGQRNNQ